jgi:hypothetical protein
MTKYIGAGGTKGGVGSSVGWVAAFWQPNII